MKHSKLHLLPRLTGFILCLAAATSGLCAEPIDAKWKQRAEQLMSKPLTVSSKNNGVSSTMTLTGIRDGQLTFTVGNNAGEASMPLDSLGDIWFRTEPPKGYNQAISILGEANFSAKHLDLIRPHAYPLVRFLGIPAKNSGFNPIVSNLLVGLLQLEQLDEASYLLSQLDLSKLGPKFETRAIELAQALTASGSIEEATSIIQQLNLKRITFANTDLVFELADLLRYQERYAEARDIYEKLKQNPKIEHNPSEQWAYYCNLKEGNYVDDQTFPETVETIEPGAPNYPLQQLVLGVYYLKRAQNEKAMRAISQGVAFATPVEDWTPELMYHSAQAYDRLEMSAISKSVYEETVRFFPTSPWATAAQNELDQ